MNNLSVNKFLPISTASDRHFVILPYPIFNQAFRMEAIFKLMVDLSLNELFYQTVQRQAAILNRRYF